MVMASKSSQSEPVFSRALTVSLRIHEKEERRCRLRITLEFQTNHNHRKELFVQLTDDLDPLLFFSLRLTEEDFQTLKNQQGLLVDFHSFPQQLIQLLEKCLTEATMDMPKFVLKLTSGGIGSENRCNALLEVVETNPFKHLCHLALHMVAGSDMQLKQYLSDGLKKLKEENESLSNQLQLTQSRMDSEILYYQDLVQQKTSELERLNLCWKQQEALLTTRLSTEVGAEREKAITTQSALERRLSCERQEAEHRYQQTTQQLEQKYEASETKSRDLMEQNKKSETAIRELKQQVVTLEGEVGFLKQDLSLIRQQNVKLDTDFHNKERALHQFQTKVAVLSQEVKDKVVLLQRQEELLGAANKEKNQLEDQMGERVNVLNRREASLQAMGEELMKANEIIKKLQGEMRNLHAKMKLKSQITSEQEKILIQKDKELQDVREVQRKLREDLDTSNKDQAKLQEQIDEREKKMEEAEKTLKTNENVIGWLNRQLNDMQIKPTFSPIAGSSGDCQLPIYTSLRGGGTPNTLPPPLAQSSQINMNAGMQGSYSRFQSNGSVTSFLRARVGSTNISPIAEGNEDDDRQQNTEPLDAHYFQPTERPLLLSKGLMRTTLNQVKADLNLGAIPKIGGKSKVIVPSRNSTKLQSKVPLNSSYFPNRRSSANST